MYCTAENPTVLHEDAAGDRRNHGRDRTAPVEPNSQLISPMAVLDLNACSNVPSTVSSPEPRPANCVLAHLRLDSPKLARPVLGRPIQCDPVHRPSSRLWAVQAHHGACSCSSLLFSFSSASLSLSLTLTLTFTTTSRRKCLPAGLPFLYFTILPLLTSIPTAVTPLIYDICICLLRMTCSICGFTSFQ